MVVQDAGAAGVLLESLNRVPCHKVRPRHRVLDPPLQIPDEQVGRRRAEAVQLAVEDIEGLVESSGDVPVAVEVRGGEFGHERAVRRHRPRPVVLPLRHALLFRDGRLCEGLSDAVRKLVAARNLARGLIWPVGAGLDAGEVGQAGWVRHAPRKRAGRLSYEAGPDRSAVSGSNGSRRDKRRRSSQQSGSNHARRVSACAFQR
mmetsp:Transcript_15617/g.49287  ORF Transcript_15617/g.49287 Transcript_15617/m.49287 type:complete len:203 (+) Transcript_15617:787-1395(+)